MNVGGMARCRLEGIYRNALSHSNLAEGILADKERFVRDLTEILEPYRDEAGRITFAAISWFVEYRRETEPR